LKLTKCGHKPSDAHHTNQQHHCTAADNHIWVIGQPKPEYFCKVSLLDKDKLFLEKEVGYTTRNGINIGESLPAATRNIDGQEEKSYYFDTRSSITGMINTLDFGFDAKSINEKVFGDVELCSSSCPMEKGNSFINDIDAALGPLLLHEILLYGTMWNFVMGEI
jgi:hypothetical protein